MKGFFGFHSLRKSRDSSVGTVTRLEVGVSGVRTLAERFKTSRPALGLIQPPTQWIWRDFSLRAKAAGPWGRTTHLRIVPRLRISRATPPHPCILSWRTQGQPLHFLIREWQFLIIYESNTLVNISLMTSCITMNQSTHDVRRLGFSDIYYLNTGPDSSVGIATELRARRFGIESRWGRDFPPVQTGPGAHPASCTMGTGSFPGVEAAGAWGWPPNPI